MKRIGKMAEIAWIIGTFVCAFGVVLCTKASFGLSMMAAPPYIAHVALVGWLPWFSQGTAEYFWEAALLLIMFLLIRKFRWKFLLCYLSGVIFGLALDLWLWVLGGGDMFATLTLRIIGFGCGILCISLSVAFVFRTYLPPQIPELLVMEVAKHFKVDPTRIKLINDISCLVLSFTLSLVCTGGLIGVGLGTVVIAFANAPLIKLWSKLIDKLFTFEPMFPKLKSWLE